MVLQILKINKPIKLHIIQLKNNPISRLTKTQPKSTNRILFIAIQKIVVVYRPNETNSKLYW